MVEMARDAGQPVGGALARKDRHHAAREEEEVGLLDAGRGALTGEVGQLCGGPCGLAAAFCQFRQGGLNRRNGTQVLLFL